MARGGLLASLKGFDAFGKTMEDVKIKTRTGALLTMISAAIICTFTLMEFVDYRRLYTDTSVIVDRSRGERLTVSLNITFPQVPCYLLSLDVMDISGDYQTNVNHNIVKNRLDERGQRIYDGNVNVGPSKFSYDQMFPAVGNDRLLNKPSSLPHKFPPPTKKKLNENAHPPPNERNSHVRQYLETKQPVTTNPPNVQPEPPVNDNTVPNNIRTTPLIPRHHTGVNNPYAQPQMNQKPPHHGRYDVDHDAPPTTKTADERIIKPGFMAGPPTGHHTTLPVHSGESHPHNPPPANPHQPFPDDYRQQPPKQPVVPVTTTSATAAHAEPSAEHNNHNDAAHDYAHTVAHALDPNAHHEIDSHNDADHKYAHKIAHVLDPNAHHESDSHNDAEHEYAHKIAHALDPDAHHEIDSHNDPKHDYAHKIAHALDPDAHHEIDSHNDAKHEYAHKIAHALDPNAHHEIDDHTGHDHGSASTDKTTSDNSNVHGNVEQTELKNELDKVAAARGPGYCGSCYGGEEPESGCCNSCDQVRQAYLLRGWSFSNPETIDQCVTEHWVEGIHEQAKEGCNIVGSLTVNKVIGNIHLSPGRSFLTNSFNIHDLVPYLKNENPHTFGHIIHEFSFENESQLYKRHLSEEMKRRLGIVYSPLDTTGSFHPDVNNMYQYFLKVVSTRYHFLDESFVSSHQFSVTTYERNLAEGYQHKGTDGVTTTHGITGMPGVFFNFEISPMMVVHHERRQSFAHFLTSMCAIIGGVLTVASMVDSLLFQTGKVIKKGVQAVAVEKDQSQSRSQFLQRPSGFGSSIKMT